MNQPDDTAEARKVAEEMQVALRRGDGSKASYDREERILLPILLAYAERVRVERNAELLRVQTDLDELSDVHQDCERQVDELLDELHDARADQVDEYDVEDDDDVFQDYDDEDDYLDEDVD